MTIATAHTKYPQLPTILHVVPSSNLRKRHDVLPGTFLKWRYIFLSPKHNMKCD